MKISTKDLVMMGACSDGLTRQTADIDEPVDVLLLIGGKNNVDDLLWLADEKLPKEKIVRFACDCALITLDKIRPYTGRFDEIKAFLDSPTAGKAQIIRNAAATAQQAAVCSAGNVFWGTAWDARNAARSVQCAADTSRLDEHKYCAGFAAKTAHRAGATADQINNLLKELFS